MFEDAVRKTGGNTLTETLALTANTTTDAVRITQTGTGNALVVEDSANPDSSPFVIDSAGNTIIGHTTSVGAGGGSASLQINSSNPLSGIRWNAANTGPSILFGKSRSATPGTFAPVIANDTLANVNFGGDDGTGIAIASRIISYVDGVVSAGSVPGMVAIQTTPVGGTSPLERLRIDSTGLINAVGGLSIAKTAVTAPAASDGNVFSGAYTPTLTNVTNITASSASAHHYSRVGNIVTMAGTVTVTPTAAAGATTTMDIALPIPSNFSVTDQCSGVAFDYSGGQIGKIESEPTGDKMRLTFAANATASRVFKYTAVYRII